MSKKYKSVAESEVTMTLLMLPSHSNFSGKIHGGFILSLLDQIAFASASKFSGNYCVTASVDTVDFLHPIEVGELVTLKACVNFVGNTSMVIGIRVEAENIQTGTVNHCNSSYFSMVAKDDKGKPTVVPALILKTEKDCRRFLNGIKRKEQRKEIQLFEEDFSIDSSKTRELLKNYNVKFDI
jgi:uncharacterized protein (TIGR00369 family)